MGVANARIEDEDEGRRLLAIGYWLSAIREAL